MDDRPDRTPSDAPLTRAERAPGLSPEEREQLTGSIRRLQASRGLIIRGADLIAGLFGGLQLPLRADCRFLRRSVEALAVVALRRAFDIAVLGFGRKVRVASPRRARLLAAAAGAISRFSGLASLLPDIAFTTLVIMRYIANVAHAQGENLDTEETRRSCREVFAFGGSQLGLEEHAEASYWSVRLILQGRPVVMLFSEAASRYGLRISEKFAIQAVPLVGAAGGALINSMFFHHYRCLAQVHFTLRRVEREHGPELVRREAMEIAHQLPRHATRSCK
jgi:hypothetical protein